MWKITDSTTTYLPDFDLRWLTPQSARYITPHISTRVGGPTTVALEAGPYVGILPLANGDTLYIEPRAGAQVLARMLSVTSRLDASVRTEFEDFARLGIGESDPVSWLRLLVRSYARQLRVIEAESLRSERVEVTFRRHAAKGRVLIAPTLLSLARHEERPIHCHFRAKSYETSEHRVLAAAAATVLTTRISGDTVGTLKRWAGQIRGQLNPTDFRNIVRRLNAGTYAGSRSYYIPALVMAQLILAQGGFNMASEYSVTGEAILTNMYILFEAYVRITLRNALSDLGYLVEKLETGAPTLFTDGTAELKPDVIISNARGYRLLLDAKYKFDETILPADYYQMAAYLFGYRVSGGMIVRPAVALKSSGVTTRHLAHGGTVHELSLGLLNLESAENALTAAVKQVLAG